MGDKKRFVPVRGTEEKIAAAVMGFNDGYLYFATDSGRIYLDYTDDEGNQIARAVVGGSGQGNSGIYYANRNLTNDEKLETEIIFRIDEIEGGVYPMRDDLIVNVPEGSFYRVTEPSPQTSSVIAERLTISGGGGGPISTLAEDIDLTLEPLDTVNLINGQSQLIYFTATSAKNNKGNEIDSRLTITYTLAYTEDNVNYTVYKTDKFMVNSGERSSFDFGQYAKKSAASKLTLKASQANAEGTITRSQEFSTSTLNLTLAASFSNASYYLPAQVNLQCNAIGDMNKIVEYYFDDEDTPFFVENLTPSDSISRSVNVQSKGIQITHGSHKVWIRLFQSINGHKGIEVDPLIFEIAVYDNSNKPIIWLGDYKTEYYSYDVIQIPFYVFDPQTNAPVVYFKKNNVELDNSPQTITNTGSYSYFEIANAELGVLNRYSISCGEGDNETVRYIELTVVQDPNRTDFGVQKTNFLTYEINTIGSGRSNNESDIKRQTLSYTYTVKENNVDAQRTISAKFNNFNWYNNGWARDENNKTCLRISNGAQLSIPLGQMVFATPSGNAATDLSHSIELMFKIRNVQDYSTLIHNITRYKNDSALYDAFYDEENGAYKTGYTNYDSFLAWYLKENYIDYEDSATGTHRALTYDDLDFDYIQKQINLSNVACGYYSGDTSSAVGLCLGPQDAFFSNGTNTVSVPYVENEIVSLSFVYQYSQVPAQNLIYVYLNGVLTSVIQNTKGAFTIESTNMVFNSSSCDIDLYKVRVYNTALNVNDVVMNYASDFENVDIYDQNKLAEENRAINEYQFSYDNMIRYNANHPNDPLMPYIIFDTSESNNGDRLSYAKSVNIPITVEFVNTPLELAYTSGELEDLAKADGLWNDGDTAAEKEAAVKEYYKHHCPSWTGYNVNMAVQGTSSEFYPRRNYKLKTKTTYDDDEASRVHIFLNRGPFAADYNADVAGLKQSKYVISNDAYDANQTYYVDKNGTETITFDANTPYRYGVYYVANPNYVELGKEKTRQSFWYMNNYTVGTTKFTMKIDYMESSGSYNMGFANLVKNGYTKHPIDDYNKAGAFNFEDASKTTYTEVTTYEAGKVYYYKNHKGNWKTTAEDELSVINNEADPETAFAMGPAGYAASIGETKVLTDESAPEYNKWYKAVLGYTALSVSNTSDYRTSVAGFRVLAFHKKSDGTYQYIGMYNMLLDKGSDEVYGFKLDKTAQQPALQAFLKNKKMSKIAECWEMENNNRTFCSFRDPLRRKDLSFDVYTMDGNRKVTTLNAVRSAPVVADSFEYRYHADADILDYIMDPIKQSAKYEEEGGDVQAYMAKNNIDFRFNKDNPSENQEERCEFLLNAYKNWEKACQWVWSTCTDHVISQGEYVVADVGLKNWLANTFYVYDAVNKEYVLDDGAAYDPDAEYYEYDSSEQGYVNAHVGALLFTEETKYDYYTQVNGSYVPCTSDDVFDESTTYYLLNNYTDEQLATKQVDRLVRKCTADDVYDANETYYTYDGTQQNGHATSVVSVTQADFEANPGNYYVGITVTYKRKNYKYDTKEYRADKFVNELSDHFDLEYMATYFVMTEVFECYDSRGKNCMMASWGPQKSGGDYIWYPIFYDIDTQLGVNNTGIPSFEYNVDATEDGNYSTSDSVLWNNFYKYFKSSAIISKYKNLRGVDSSFRKLDNPPIRTVDYAESWYNTDPDVCKSIAMRGKRPLVAKNLDEYYKYITITNNASYENGITGHIQSDTSGTWTYDSEGKYFYMLQGDRSLSRRQFLANRLEYIDSWLNQGNYQRGGANRIRGRVAANNSAKTSDKWVETPEDPYYDLEGNKRHLFDAEYWLTLTPTHSSYVTLGDDNEAYPSQKYDGIHPLKFNVSAIESGVRTSRNYPEQLLYIYGINQMQDLGDMSKLYWQEFAIEGDASKLTSLRLGYDGTMTENGETLTYYNNNVNQPSFPASKNATGMPLLKEVNLCNMQINMGSPTLDLTSCEKLENFRATGSNYIDIQFAEGVALNTLYLPTSLKTLKLTEARLLKNLITSYQVPQLNNEGKLVAQPGLYLQGMFENNATDITTLNILGSGMGYDSYKLLKKYYDIRSAQTATPSDIQMTNVEWSPFVKVAADEDYNSSLTYFEDNGHYGLSPYTYNFENWVIKTANGEIYKQVKELNDPNVTQIQNIEMFEHFINDNISVSGQTIKKFRTDVNNPVPNITGIIYVANDSEHAVNEYTIRNSVQNRFPNLTFFFNSVNEAYTAKFLLMDADEGENGKYTLVGSQTIESGWFNNPIDEYGDISRLKQNHDFYGWALSNSLEAEILVNVDKSINRWNTLSLDSSKHTYYFYAVCPIHKWKVDFYNGNSIFETVRVPHGQSIDGPTSAPYRDDSDLPLEQTYQLLGYNRNANASTPMNLSNFEIIGDTVFYAIWNSEPVSVYDNIHPEWFEIINADTDYMQQYHGMNIKLKKAVRGKLTIPNSIDGTPVIIFSSNCTTQSSPRDSLLNDVTHIFLQKDNNGQTNLKSISNYTFTYCSNLQYFDFAEGLLNIGARAFFGVNNLSDVYMIGGTITTIGNLAFGDAINNTTSLVKDLIVDGCVVNLAASAFGNLNNGVFDTLQLGSAEKKWQITSFNRPFLNNIAKFNKLLIYAADPTASIFQTENRYTLLTTIFGASNDTIEVTIM